MTGLPSDPFELPYSTVPGLLEGRTEELGDEALMRYGDETLTYAEVDARANAVANSLANRGVGPGDHVATLLYNSPEHLCTWFGVAKLGAVLVPINVNVKAGGLAHVINDSDSETIVFEKETLENYETARGDLDSVPREFCLGVSDADYEPFDVLSEGDRSTNPGASVSLADPMSIIYTSGTTGLPKGVVLPHFSYINTGLRATAGYDISTGSRLFTTLPLFHCNAQQATVMPAMLAGTSFVLERWFSASGFWDSIRAQGATHFNFIGTMLTALVNQPDRSDDADNPARFGVGAPVPDGYYELFEERFGVHLAEGYGLTETATSAARNPPEAVREGSFGKPHPHVEMAIVDEQDRRLSPGEEGEIVVRNTIPFTLMLEYYGRPDATVEAWRNLWFHTGDIGYVDEDGYFYFVDRKAHSIRRRGENIATAEVERILEEHPAVAECAVVGVPAELGEEDVKAFVLVDSEQTVEPAALVEWCEDRLAYFKVPRYVEFVNRFPKTPTERVRKHELKERGVGSAWDREGDGYELQR